MREDDVFRVDITDVMMEREADVFVSEIEMSEELEISLELPDIFMLDRLSVPAVWREKTEAEEKDA